MVFTHGIMNTIHGKLMAFLERSHGKRGAKGAGTRTILTDEISLCGQAINLDVTEESLETVEQVHALVAVRVTLCVVECIKLGKKLLTLKIQKWSFEIVLKL
ncbi:hypothetical protein BI308_10355 [Roseofilum reptotaenium AO1-A]|uniref:Uncharacterized protein n=1 Tax=Roseofilum reptotaenium AO1-A TaxID=1925591 RepID=A0A1L9QST5_9CYAN|nr:hypothetical protein BI308_10355 [Roseofilum reptotaenium AO1-A]